MARKARRLVSRGTACSVKNCTPSVPNIQLELFADDIKKVMPITVTSEKETATDRLFRIIYDNSTRGYSFTEPSSGIPWIRHEDIEDRGDGIFVIKFRCPQNYINGVHFWYMANRVLYSMKSKPHLFHETKTENGISYEECIWVIHEGDREKESDAEEQTVQEQTEESNIDEFEEALSNFV